MTTFCKYLLLAIVTDKPWPNERTLFDKHLRFCLSRKMFVSLATMQTFYTIERNEGLWLANWDPTFGMLLLANLSKHNIRFYNKELERKITKGNSTLTPWMHSIIRCCTSRCKSRCRCCTFKRKSRCNETFVMHQWIAPIFKCRKKSRVQFVIST